MIEGEEDEYTKEWLDDEEVTTERVGHQRGKAPRNNKKQNKQAKDAARRLGLKDAKDKRKLHELINKQGKSYQEILEEWKNYWGSR